MLYPTPRHFGTLCTMPSAKQAYAYAQAGDLRQAGLRLRLRDCGWARYSSDVRRAQKALQVFPCKNYRLYTTLEIRLLKGAAPLSKLPSQTTRLFLVKSERIGRAIALAGCRGDGEILLPCSPFTSLWGIG